MDTVILGFLSNEHSVGLYTAGVKLTRITLPVVTSVGIVLIPRITQNMVAGNTAATQQLLDAAWHFIILLSVPITMGLVILAPEFITVFSGSKFIQAAICMQILSLLPLLVGMGYFFCFLILVPGGRNREMFLAVAWGLLVFFLANFLLVPFLEETGTAIANSVTELTVTLLYFYYVRKKFTYTFSWRPFIPALICSATFVPVIQLVRRLKINDFTMLGVSVVICGSIYIFLQLFIFRNALLQQSMQQVRQKIRGLKKVR
jgi:O-antigen/teichoic acid export membrane protein